MIGPLTGRLLPSQSLGTGQPCVLVLEAQVKVNLFWLALPTVALLPSGIELSLLQSSGGSAFTSCPTGLWGFSHCSDQLRGV